MVASLEVAVSTAANTNIRLIKAKIGSKRFSLGRSLKLLAANKTNKDKPSVAKMSEMIGMVTLVQRCRNRMDNLVLHRFLG